METGIDKLVCVGCYQIPMSPFENTIRKLSFKKSPLSGQHFAILPEFYPYVEYLAMVLTSTVWKWNCVWTSKRPVKSAASDSAQRGAELDVFDFAGSLGKSFTVFAPFLRPAYCISGRTLESIRMYLWVGDDIPNGKNGRYAFHTALC